MAEEHQEEGNSNKHEQREKYLKRRRLMIVRCSQLREKHKEERRVMAVGAKQEKNTKRR
jgi:hypothetical protein